MTLNANQKGMAYKVPDSQVVPLCDDCHGYWDGGRDGPRNPFTGLTSDDKYAKAAAWVAATWKLAIPEDEDQALIFEELGLGRNEKTDTGFVWYSILLSEPGAAASSLGVGETPPPRQG